MGLKMEERALISFEKRLENFRAQEDDKYAWIQEIEKERAELLYKYKIVCNDLKNETDGRRLAQEREDEYKQKYDAICSTLDDNAFVLVLIDADADGYLFDEKYLIAGESGGASAAHDLKQAIQEQLAKVLPTVAKVPLMVKAYAHIDGLAGALRRSGMMHAAEQLSSFALGFSQADSLFDFVAVGTGKERADHKIRGILNQFIHNPTCKHIVFGGCHDNGYVRSLEGFARNPSVRDRLSLLQSFETGREFASLPFQTFQLDGIFRDCSLPLPSPPMQVKRISIDQSAPTNGLERIGTSYAAKARVVNSPPESPSSPPLLKSKPALSAGCILVNAHDERLDESLTQPSASAIDSFNRKTKVDGERYCNMYQLQGTCPERLCRYSHETLTDAELLVLRVLMRSQVCAAGSSCRRASCFYGHHCSANCTVRKCRFSAEMHGVDRRGAKQVKGC